MGQPLGGGPARVGRGGEGGQDVVVEEMGERPVADVVEQSGHAQGLDHQAFRRDRLGGCEQRAAQARVERPRPQAGLVHHPQAMGEARVLGCREDPAGALQLADPAQPLEPGRVEQVLLGDVLVGNPAALDSPGSRRLVSSTYPWIGSLIRFTARNGCRRITGSWHPDAKLDRPGPEVPGPVARPNAQAVPVTPRPVGRGTRPWPWSAVLTVTQLPRSVRCWTVKSRRPAVWVWRAGSAPHQDQRTSSPETVALTIVARGRRPVPRLGKDDRAVASTPSSTGRGRCRGSCRSSSSGASSAADSTPTARTAPRPIRRRTPRYRR